MLYIVISLITTFSLISDVSARTGPQFNDKENYYNQLRAENPSASRESIVEQVNTRYPDTYTGDSAYFTDRTSSSTEPAPSQANVSNQAATATPDTPATLTDQSASAGTTSNPATSEAVPDGRETDIASSSESPQNTETTPVLTPEQTETALEVASQQALSQDTRTDEQIAADNQAALNEAASTNNNPSVGSSNNILGVNNNDLRKGNVSMDTIPLVLVSIINVLLGVAGTISIVALIYYAVQMQINSGITGDSSGVDNAKRGMKGAILGFIVAILAWFIVIRFVEILSSMS